MTFNPLQNRDLSTELRFPTMSASSMGAWNFKSRDCTEEQAHEKWYKLYVRGEKFPESPAIVSGKIIGEKLITDPTYLPEVPRPEIYEFTVPRTKFRDMWFIGHMDGWSSKTNELLEYKTSQSETYWNQKSVDNNDQISFYYLLLLYKFKIHPKDIRARLVYIPVHMSGNFEVMRSNKPIQIFETKRTMLQILTFGQKVFQTHKEMEEFVHNHV